MVALRVHPRAVNLGGRMAHGDIFGDGAEARSGLGGAFGEILLTGVAMGEFRFLGHELGVSEGSFGKGGVPHDRLLSAIGAGLIGEVYEALFVGFLSFGEIEAVLTFVYSMLPIIP